MSSTELDHYLPSSYKRRVSVRSASHGAGGQTGSRYASSNYSLPVASFATSSHRRYPAYARSSLSHSTTYSAPLSAAVSELRLDQAAQISSEFKISRTQEKAELQDLNDRFASFIDRVHELEQQNQLLETELVILRQRQSEPSNLHNLYEHEIRQLRAAVEEARHDKQAVQNHKDGMEEVLKSLQNSYEKEVTGRQKAEGRLLDARKKADEAALSRAELEKRVETLLDELSFLKDLCESEIAELQAQIQYSTDISVGMEMSKPDLSTDLRDIRVQYEKLAQQNLQSAEEWFRNKVSTMTVGSAWNTEGARNAKDEAGEYRRLLKSRTLEIDACRGMNQILEKQLQEVDEKQSAEISSLQDTIGQLEDELRASKNDMARHMKDYQDLLNVKMALDIEIAAYRKLLEGEEKRLSTPGTGSGFTYPQTMYAGLPFGQKQVSMQSQLSSASPYLLSYRLRSSAPSAEEEIAASHAQQAEASPTQEEDEQEEEEKKEGEENEEDEEEDGDEAEGEQGGEEEGDEGSQEEKEDNLNEEDADREGAGSQPDEEGESLQKEDTNASDIEEKSQTEEAAEGKAGKTHKKV